MSNQDDPTHDLTTPEPEVRVEATAQFIPESGWRATVEPESSEQSYAPTDEQSDDPTDEHHLLDPVFEAMIELMKIRGTRVSLAEIAEYVQVPIHQLDYANTDEILVAFIGHLFDRADREVRSIDGFERFNLNEKIHALLEALLDRLEPHRALLPRLSLRLGAASMLRPRYMTQLRRHYASIVADYFREAVDEREIPDIDLDSPIIRSFADHASTVIAYWLRDRSPNHESTTEYIDQSLSIVIPAAISTGRIRGLGGFLRRRLQTFVQSGQTSTRSGFRPVGLRPADIRHRFSR
ncbi:hypothetical protein ACNOYE_35650 [Nannocystaceae bacterium ST9]